VTLPSPFALDWVSDPDTLAPAPKTFSRSAASPVFIVWDPFGAPDFEPGDTLHFAVTGQCIETYSGTIDWQAGEDVLELTGVLEDAAPPRDGRICPTRVEITLRRQGVIDAAYAGGAFVGEQVRTLRLISTP
jgi:hypothetical protein